MKSVKDFMDEWIKRLEESWNKEDTLSEGDLGTEFVLDYWDRDGEEESHPPHSLRRAAKNKAIRNAIEENKVYDIDRLFWNGGKLFGYDTYYETLLGGIGDCDEKIGPFIKVMRNGEEYEILLKFDWEKCFLSLTCNSFNPYIIEPVGAKATVLFDTLFGVEDSVVKLLIDTEIEKLINTIERLRNDGKKDNRNS